MVKAAPAAIFIGLCIDGNAEICYVPKCDGPDWTYTDKR